MKITRQDVEHVARLSRLEIDGEIDQFTAQLDAILSYMDKLNELDTSGVEPMAHVLPLRNVTRPDTVQPSLSQERALANAPEQQDGYFKVPRIIEG